MNEVRYKPIGIIHSAFKETEGLPIQSIAASDVEGLVEILPEYSQGLRDIEGFSHIFLIYHFHKARRPQLIGWLQNRINRLSETKSDDRFVK